MQSWRVVNWQLEAEPVARNWRLGIPQSIAAALNTEVQNAQLPLWVRCCTFKVLLQNLCVALVALQAPQRVQCQLLRKLWWTVFILEFRVAEFRAGLGWVADKHLLTYPRVNFL